MSFLSRLGFKSKPSSASAAKERLKILISHEKIQSQAPDFLPELKKEILEVISKYVTIDPEQIQIAMDCAGDSSSLELNVVIPDTVTSEETTTTAETETA